MKQHMYLDGVLGLATGDALGAPAEFGERWMRDEDPVKGMRNGGLFELPAGSWTDDTAMVLATMDSLRHGFDLRDMTERFLQWLRNGAYTSTGETVGIGNQILEALERYEISRDPRSCGGTGEMDNGNGALMRILPVCLYCRNEKRNGRITQAEGLERIHAAAGITHGHPRSLMACGLYYFMAEAVLDGTGSLTQRLQQGLDRGFAFYRQEEGFVSEEKNYARLRNLTVFRETSRDQIRSTGYVVDSLEAAVWCLITENGFRESLLKAVNLGLDADTIAAVAGGLAGLYYGYEQIPPEWLNGLRKREEIQALCARMEEGEEYGQVSTGI